MVRREDQRHPRSGHDRFSINHGFQPSLHDVPDFFVLVGVFVNDGTSVELPMREGHRLSAEQLAVPSRQLLQRRQVIGIDEFYANLRNRCTDPTWTGSLVA